MFDKVASDLFDQLIWPNWQKNIGNGISPKIWQKAFIKVAKESSIISIDLANKLATSTPLLNLMNKSFDNNSQFPSAHAFAVSIAYEMSQDHFDCDVKQLPELWRLRFFASAIRAQWLESIESSFLLKKRFIQIHNSQPIYLLDVNADCPPELDLLLCDANALNSAYFRTCYSNNTASSLPNMPSASVDYNDQDYFTHFEDSFTQSLTLYSSSSEKYDFVPLPSDKSKYNVVHPSLSVA